MTKPTLCLDFDGVLHSYSSGWKGASTIPDEPVDGAGAYLLTAVQHFNVAIFSSRSKSILGRRAMKYWLRDVLWDACLDNVDLADAAWGAVAGKPQDHRPWTLYDVREQAEEIMRGISWPWFKPTALITIDDRAITFNGNWLDPLYPPDAIKAFKPWNKRDFQDQAVALPYGANEGDLGSVPL